MPVFGFSVGVAVTIVVMILNGNRQRRILVGQSVVLRLYLA